MEIEILDHLLWQFYYTINLIIISKICQANILTSNSIFLNENLPIRAVCQLRLPYVHLDIVFSNSVYFKIGIFHL